MSRIPFHRPHVVGTELGFVPRDLEPVPAAPEEHEVFEVEWLPLDEAVGLAVRGELRDAKTLVGLAWAAARLGVGPDEAVS